MRHQALSNFLAGFKSGFPIFAGLLGIGFASGAIAVQNGLSTGEIVLLCLFVFAGSAQFVFADLYTGSAVILISTIFFINLRHLLYSFAIIPRLPFSSFFKRLIMGTQLIDETFTLSTGIHKQIPSFSWMVGLNMSAYLGWLIGNIIGSFFDNSTLVRLTGIEFALAAMFIAILVLAIRNKRGGLVGISALVATSVAVFIGLQTIFFHTSNIVISVCIATTLFVVAEHWFKKWRQRDTS